MICETRIILEDKEVEYIKKVIQERYGSLRKYGRLHSIENGLKVGTRTQILGFLTPKLDRRETITPRQYRKWFAELGIDFLDNVKWVYEQ